MQIDLSKMRLNAGAFSPSPMAFCAPDFLNPLLPVLNLSLLETAPRKTIDRWQANQLKNLFKHAKARSNFWRQRLQGIDPRHLDDAPILTRQDLVTQVESEGALLHQADQIEVYKHGTSGSSGTPVEFFLSRMNANYNAQRSIAQYLLEGRDLKRNKTRFKNLPLKDFGKPLPGGFQVKKRPSWLGPFARFVDSGPLKQISYLDPDLDALCSELATDDIGYLVAQPRLLETLQRRGQLEALFAHKVEMLITVTESPQDELRAIFTRYKVPVRSSYSCEEVGLIGSECPHHPNHYHVAQSNVVVETAPIENGQSETLARLLITHLHSYATPFIRYDVGDVGMLLAQCPCGHDGPTLTSIVGRSKGLILHADHRVSPFSVRAGDLASLAKFDEYRIRQTAPERLILELARQSPLSPEETQNITTYLKRLSSPAFEIEVLTSKKIDWGNSVKRLAFKNEIIG